MLIVFYIFGRFFRGLKFHKSIKSAKFAEFKYLEKTNYTVTNQYVHETIRVIKLVHCKEAEIDSVSLDWLIQSD